MTGKQKHTSFCVGNYTPIQRALGIQIVNSSLKKIFFKLNLFMKCIIIGKIIIINGGEINGGDFNRKQVFNW